MPRFHGGSIYTHKRRNPYLALAVWTVIRTRAGGIKKVTEYIDMSAGETVDPETGEILPGKVIPAEAVQTTVLDLRYKWAKQEQAFARLHPEVRQFGLFVLDFRNLRRGITPGINTLCHWYADLIGKRVDNVRRYIPKLEDAGILAGENLLGRLFQFSGGSASSTMGEDGKAFVRLVAQYKTGRKGPLRQQGCAASAGMNEMPRPRPAWMADAGPTGNVLSYEGYCDLMRLVRLPITLGPRQVACAQAASETLADAPLPGATFRERIKGLGVDDARLMISRYLGQRQRSPHLDA